MNLKLSLIVIFCACLALLAAGQKSTQQEVQDQEPQEEQEHDSFGDDPATTSAPNSSCAEGQYACHNSALCIQYTWRCDDIEDCPNQDDEKNCESSSCPEDTHWRCPSTGRCILAKWKCDGDLDCDNGEDEKNCSKNTCTDEWFQCASGACISPNFICDGDLDCPDGDDETRSMCVNRCTEGFFLCARSEPMRCLPGTWACDGDRDCTEGEDEQNCVAATSSTTTAAPIAFDAGKSPPSSPSGGKGIQGILKGYHHHKNQAKNNKKFKYGPINNRNKI